MVWLTAVLEGVPGAVGYGVAQRATVKVSSICRNVRQLLPKEELQCFPSEGKREKMVLLGEHLAGQGKPPCGKMDWMTWMETGERSAHLPLRFQLPPVVFRGSFGLSWLFHASVESEMLHLVSSSSEEPVGVALLLTCSTVFRAVVHVKCSKMTCST